MTDFSSRPPGITDPARRLVAVDPDDDAVLPEGVRALRVGTGGDLTVLAAGDTEPVTFVNVQDGELIPVLAEKVMATGTDAEDIVALI